MIVVQHLCRSYGDLKAVDDVSFEIGKGEVVGLLGHNGAGKTTIMKIITGYLEPTSGTVHVAGLEIGKDSKKIQQKIGYLPENCPVWPEMTVIDYLEYQADLRAMPLGQRSGAVRRAIERTALRDKATAPIQTLSRGYRQRVGVAQAILSEPEIIILDEPTNGLDPTQIHQMRGLIRDLAKTSTVIVSTHILQEVQAVCERVLIMRSGQKVLDSKLDALQRTGRLLVSMGGKPGAALLERIEGVEKVELLGVDAGQCRYRLSCERDVAPKVAMAVQADGRALYQLQPETRNLETVFAEVNASKL